MTEEEKKKKFIQRAKEIHGDKFDYSKVVYKNNRTKVCIICPEHGEFWQTPYHHLKGHSCTRCGHKNSWDKNNRKMTFNDFKKKLVEKYGDIYDLSKVEYINTHTKILIGYNGKYFYTLPSRLLYSGTKTPIRHDFVESKEEFIKKANNIHGFKYGYSNINYINATTKVKIFCPEHGMFEQRPNDHISGCGCPICTKESKRSKSEEKIAKYLRDNKISFIEQHSPDFLNNGFSHQKFDFFLNDYNVVIEYQGPQHFKDNNFFMSSLSENISRDVKKNKVTKENGLTICYIVERHIKLKDILDNDTYSNIYVKENTFKTIEKLIDKIVYNG